MDGYVTYERGSLGAGLLFSFGGNVLVRVFKRFKCEKEFVSLLNWVGFGCREGF